MMMFLVWIVAGLLAGWFFHTVLSPKEEKRRGTTLVIGGVGAVIGGWLAITYGNAPSLPASIVAALAGAGVLLLAWKVRAIRSESAR